MSISVNPTLNVNIDVYRESVQNAVPGLENLPAGTPVPQITQAALTQMTTKLLSQWTTTFPSVTLPPSNNDAGYVGPWSDNVAGTAVPCAVQQITSDFSNWGVPLSNDTVPTTITKTITQEIASKGGQAGFSSGTFQLTSSENIWWMCGYATVAISETENGILYVFAATAGINL